MSDIVCLASTGPAFFATPAAGWDCFRTLIHRARCASAIFRREAADMTRFGAFVFTDLPEPFSDSITEIA